MELVENDLLENEFERHLELSGNNRIIVSGKFGAGKSTFLNNFFSNRNYNVFKISPVKYSVGSNEDIFEYIKFELISQICLNHISQSDKNGIPESLYVWSYFNNNFSPILNKFIDIVVSLKPETQIAIDSVKNIANIHGNYKKYKNELKSKDVQDFEYYFEYLKSGLNKVGSIFEDDLITQSIRTFILTLRESKKNILLIDDFDRIDPEHIFRILNVLSAHQDYLGQEHENKFGFDSIIIVCDIDTIKSIYDHKYGSNANFEGYISKFCSSKYFRFSNLLQVKEFCERVLLKNLKSEDHKITLFIILNYFLDSGYFTLRDLLKLKFDKLISKNDILTEYEFKSNNFCNNCRFIDSDLIVVDPGYFNFLGVVSILVNIFGDFDRLFEVVKELSQIKIHKPLTEEQYQSLLKSIGPLSHWVKSNGTTIPFCVEYDDQSGHGNRNTHIKTPSFDFMKVRISIKLPWNKLERYKGDSGYFKNMELKYTVSREKLNAFNELFQELRIILAFLRDNGFSNKM